MFATARINSISANIIFVDFGANGYIFRKKSVFINLVYFSYSIDTADNFAFLDIERAGTVLFRVSDADGNMIDLELNEVVYISNIQCNFILFYLLRVKVKLKSE